MTGILQVPSIEIKYPELLVITLLTGIVVHKSGSVGRKESSPRLETRLLICLLLGGNERGKKLVYIKDTKSLVAFNMLCSRLEV